MESVVASTNYPSSSNFVLVINNKNNFEIKNTLELHNLLKDIKTNKRQITM